MKRKNRKSILNIFLTILLMINCSIIAPLQVKTLAVSSGKVSVTDKNIKYFGRYEINGDRLTLNFESGLEMAFNGTSIKLDIGAVPTSFLYSIDDEEYKEVTGASGIYTIKGNMKNGRHTLRMYAPWESVTTTFSGFLLDSGSMLLADSNKPTIEFIGDSITAGWIGGDNSIYGFKYSYPLIVSEKLGFSGNAVAVAGICLLPGAGSDTIGMTNRYFKSHFNDGIGLGDWDTEKYVPDYIVINLGTNDNADGDIFLNGYVDFLGKLRNVYKETIFFVVAPFNGKYRNETKNAVQKMNASGDDKVRYIDTLGWTDSNETTDGLHPTIGAQKKLAVLLADELKNHIYGNGKSISYGKYVPVTDKNVKFLGRKDISGETAKVYFESGVELTFSGKSVKLNIGDGNTSFIYSIDGSEFEEVGSATGIYTIRDNMNQGIHTLKIYSPWENTMLEFAGFWIGQNERTYSKRTPTIEFIGDSLTTAYVGGTDNAYGLQYSYSVKVGELLGFSHNTVAYGGMGLLPVNGNSSLSMSKQYFKKYLDLTGNAPDWNTQEYIPDYIVVNLGTSDTVTEKEFFDGYSDFLINLRNAYPNTTIFSVAPFGGKFRIETEKAVNIRRSKGDNKIVFINTEGWLSVADTTDRIHPTVNKQIDLSQKLYDAIRDYINGVNKNETFVAIEKSDFESKDEVNKLVTPEKVKIKFTINKKYLWISCGLLMLSILLFVFFIITRKKGSKT